MDASKRIFTENWQAYNDGVRVVANKGGTRSGKTFSILILLFKIALSADKPLLVSVVSESFPHLKRGAMRDFAKLVESTGMMEDKHFTHSRTEHLYTFKGGGQVEFFSADNASKVHGAQRDILFVNECNHIEWEIYRQLAVRTSGTIFLDWNPATKFWFEDKGVETQPTTRVVHSTYLDNPFLTDRQVAEIESYKSDENWWRVYGLGETGSVEGLIYTNWDITNTLPVDIGRTVYGIDFGFSIDPTAIVKVMLAHGEIYVTTLAYDRGMDNAAIARRLTDDGCTSASDIVADSAEPKSIAEINNAGSLNVQPVAKGADSIRYGIEVTQRTRLHIHAEAVELIAELRGYMWKRDKDGNWLQQPTGPDHALDALRYVMMTYFDIQPTGMPRQSRGRRLW